MAPIPSLGGLALKGLARTGLGRRAIRGTQEKLAETTPTTLPGFLQRGVARAATPQQFQQFGETLAETGGFLGTRQLVKGTALGQDIFSLGKKLFNVKLFQSDEALANVGKQGKNIIKNIEAELGSDIGKTFKSPIGDKPVNINKVNQAFNKIPERVINKLKNAGKVFGIEFVKTGTGAKTLKPTARNMWKVRKFFDDFLTTKDFIDTGKIEKQTIKNGRNILAEVLREADPKIAPVMKAFSEFESKATTLKPLFTKTQTDPTPVFNKLRTLFSSKGEPGVRVVFNQVKELNEIKDFIKAFNRGQLLKKVGLGLTGAIAFGAARRKGQRAIEGQEPIEIDGQ